MGAAGRVADDAAGDGLFEGTDDDYAALSRLLRQEFGAEVVSRFDAADVLQQPVDDIVGTLGAANYCVGVPLHTYSLAEFARRKREALAHVRLQRVFVISGHLLGALELMFAQDDGGAALVGRGTRYLRSYIATVNFA